MHRSWSVIRRGVRRLFRLGLRRPDLVRSDIDDELAFHLESRIEYLIARGRTPNEARAEALRRLGSDVDTARQRLHRSAELRESRMRVREWADDLVQDIRYAARGLIHRPGFMAIAVLTLAIGMGATTAIFSAVYALMLRPLPFADPDRLMTVSLSTPPGELNPLGNRDMVWSYPKYIVFRDAQRAFADLSLYARSEFNVTGGEAERVIGEVVGARYLPTLGISVAKGRNFNAEEDAHPGAARVAIIGDALWQRRFNADPATIGRPIDIDGSPYEIVGVAAPEFRGLTGQAEIFVPITTRSAADLAEAQSHEFQLVARRKPNVTESQATTEVTQLGKRVDAAYPGGDSQRHWGAGAVALDATRVAVPVRRLLLVLFGGVAFVLLIACVNLASLLLGRAAARRREIAIRLAIGASRGRLVRLLLAESVLLSLLGGATSVLVAWWGARALNAFNPVESLGSRLQGLGVIGHSSIAVDTPALLFTLCTALLVGVVFGLIPAVQATRPSLTGGLKEGGTASRGADGSRGTVSRKLLVVVEVALALVLLVGSGLMLRSLARLLAVDSGIDARQVLTLRLTVPYEGAQRDSLPGFAAQLVDRLHALPGVTDVALADCPPLSGGCNGTGLSFLDRPKGPKGSDPSVGVHWVSPGWYAALRVPLVRGRLFTDADRVGGEKVVVVNETAARRFWPNESPIGKRVAIWQGGFNDGATVIGVVGDVRFNTIDTPAKPDVYLSYYQSPRTRLMVYLRASGDPSSLTAPARRIIGALAPMYPVYDVQLMSSRVAAATARPRFSAVLLTLFAGVALALAVIGIYGVMSFAVVQRTHEIGIRMALGAGRSDVLRLIVRQGMALALWGTVVGVVAALGLTRTLESLLYDVRPSDPATFATIVLLLLVTALVASWIPARRATRVQPTDALKG
jgi:putative ABC transport system permease protein